MSAAQPLHRNLPLLLLHAREAALAHFRPILKRSRLTEQQWRILRVLAVGPEAGMEAGQLADACQILSPSLTGIATRLETSRLIRRVWSEEDQRRQIIGLTKAGAELVARVLPEIEAQYRQLEASLGDTTLEEIYQSVDRITTLLCRPLAERPSVTVSARETRGRAVAGPGAGVKVGVKVGVKAGGSPGSELRTARHEPDKPR